MKSILDVLILLSMIAIPISAAIHYSIYLMKQPNTFEKQEASIEEVNRLNGIDFEYYLKPLFEVADYEVQVTKGSGEYGADLFLTRNSKLTVVQAKRYSSNIGVSAVQEIVASIAYYKADHAIVITNQYFTKQATVLAKVNGVELLDRNDLRYMIEKYNNRTSPTMWEQFVSQFKLKQSE